MEKEGIVINGIYLHNKLEGNQIVAKNYYKVIDICYSHADQNEIFVVYDRCDENGIFQSIRLQPADVIIKQPFISSIERFKSNIVGGYPANPAVQRFQFFRHS
jgi:hypothetical protein